MYMSSAGILGRRCERAFFFAMNDEWCALSSEDGENYDT